METNSRITKLTQQRKLDHLSICTTKDVSFKKLSSGFEDFRFIHQALPEINLNDIDLSVDIFGKKLNIPLMISPLVGGVEITEKINRNLAIAAQSTKIAMGIGSQRIALEDPDGSGAAGSFQIRNSAPDILLFSNIGAVQLNYGFDESHCRKAVKMSGADALMLHLNPMQEAFQYEGNHNFSGLFSRIEKICNSVNFPVLAREVGFGISENTAARLISAGVKGIDTGGAGGTSWIEVEKFRSDSNAVKKVAENFDEWGIPSAESLIMVKNAINKIRNKKGQDIVLIASGGIRSGIDAAKAIALGADLVGIGLPMLKEINRSVESCIAYIREIEIGLRIAMFGIGAGSINELKNSEFIIKK